MRRVVLIPVIFHLAVVAAHIELNRIDIGTAVERAARVALGDRVVAGTAVERAAIQVIEGVVPVTAEEDRGPGDGIVCSITAGASKAVAIMSARLPANDRRSMPYSLDARDLEASTIPVGSLAPPWA